MTMHAIGHVDDEANLTGFDQDGETEVILRTGRDVFGGVNTEQGQYLLGFSVSGMNMPIGQGVLVTLGQSKGSLNYLLRDLLELFKTIGGMRVQRCLF